MARITKEFLAGGPRARLSDLTGLLQQGHNEWDGDALLEMMAADDLNTSGLAWDVAHRQIHGATANDPRERYYAQTNITPEQYAWAEQQAENLGLPGQPIGNRLEQELAPLDLDPTGYHGMSPYAAGLLSSRNVPLPKPVFDNAVERAKTLKSTTATEGIARRMARGQLTGEQRRHAAKGIGWSQLLGQSGAWSSSHGDVKPKPLSVEEEQEAWDQLRAAAERENAAPSGDELIRMEPLTGLSTLLDQSGGNLPREHYEALINKDHPVFSHPGNRVPGDLDTQKYRLHRAAIRETPYPEHHQLVLDRLSNAMADINDLGAEDAKYDLETLLNHNRHLKSDFGRAIFKKGYYSILAKNGSGILLRPENRDMVEELHQKALKDKDPHLAWELIRNDVTDRDQSRTLIQAMPKLKEKIADHWDHFIDPDIFATQKLGVAFSTNKLRQTRDLILSKGKTEMSPKELPPGDWSAGRLPNGNISAAKLQGAIDSAPRIHYNVTHGAWDGGQRHSEDNSNVFQLNLTTDQVDKLKQAGVYDVFRRMYDTSTRSSHPVGPAGIGWVRWTGGKGKGIFIDEVQSDMGQSFVKQTANQVKEAVRQGQMTAEAGEQALRNAEEQFPEEAYKKISDIVFGGKHPSETLQEAFHEWLRTPHEETRSEMFANGLPKCEKCGSTSRLHSNDGMGNVVCASRLSTPAAQCREPFKPRTVDYRGEPIHIWQPESKATMSLGRESEKLPGHFYVGYRDVPQKKMGMKPGEYGELPTQYNHEHQSRNEQGAMRYVRPCESCNHELSLDQDSFGSGFERGVRCPSCGIKQSSMEGFRRVGRDEQPIPGKPTWKDEVRKSEDQREVRPNHAHQEHALPSQLHAEGYRLTISHMPGIAIATVHRHGTVVGHVELVDWKPKEEWANGGPHRAGLRDAVVRILEGHAKGKQEEDAWNHPVPGPKLLAKAEPQETGSMPVSNLLVSNRSMQGAQANVLAGRGSRSKGPLSVWRLEDGRNLLVDGHHRLVEHLRRGSTSVPYKVVGEGYTDYWATPTDPFQHAPMAKAEPGDLHPEKPTGFHEQPAGSHITAPHPSYAHASAAKPKGTEYQGGKNIHVRQHSDPSNAGRTLMVQFSSDLLQGNRPHDHSDDYYDNLYAKREGYHRPADWWEVPAWQAHIAHSMPNTDHYTVRDPAEAIEFLRHAGYKNAAFSSLDVTAPFIKQLATALPDQHIAVGGYTDMGMYAQHPNVSVHPSVQSFVESEGYDYKPGYDYRHFAGVKTIPRLTLSDGCRHNCTFCCVPKQVIEKPMDEVMQQADAFGKHLDSELIYLNDKTFGQAANHTQLPALYQRIKAQNPNFKGFVIQTTAAQMRRMTPEFLKASGIRHVELGIESVNDAILKAHKKPANEAIIEEAAQKIRAAGASLIPNIMVGLPGEDKNTYGRTMDWLKKNRDIISHVNAYNLALYEESELGKKLQVVNAADRDENQQIKSWMTDPQVHRDFSDELFRFGNEQLNQPVGHVDVDQELGLKKGDEYLYHGTYAGNLPGIRSLGLVPSDEANEGRLVFGTTDPEAAKGYGNALLRFRKPSEAYQRPGAGTSAAPHEWLHGKTVPPSLIDVLHGGGWRPLAQHPEMAKSEDPHPPAAATVLVHNEQGLVLWGKRRKDGKWTLPGGHLEPGEDPATGAVRELLEEAGVTPEAIHHFGTANSPDGLPVFMFHATVADQQPHTGFDPDHEVEYWSWIDCLAGLPEEIRKNLAHQPNAVVEHMMW